jgi:subtilisin family serine protease
MRRLSVFITIIMILVMVTPTLAQVQDFAPDSAELRASKNGYDSYIVIMDLMPVATYNGGIAGLEATQPGLGEKIDPNSAAVQGYQNLLVDRQNASLEKAGVSLDNKVHSYTIALNGYSAILTPAEAAQIALQPDVVLVMPDELRQPDTDSSPNFLGLTDEGGAYDSGYTGEHVIVGVIDSGIWPEHPSFADDGTYRSLPIAEPACEFGNTAHNPNDAPFTCNNKLLGADQVLDTYRLLIGADPDEYDSARDDNGHGTHTASTAAGNGGVEASLYGIPRGTISGIAPRARVIAYKGLGNLGGFTSDLAAAIDQAVADGVDVINYSIGGGAGGPGADEIAFLFAEAAGVFVATSAGNSGPGEATLGNPGTMPWMTTVGASTQSRFFQGTAVLGDDSEYAGASITPGVGRTALVDAEDAGGDLCVPGTLDPSVVTGNIVLCRRGSIARADKSLAVFEAGGVGMIMYNNSDDDNLFSDTHWVPSVHVDNTPGLAVKAYIDSASSPTAHINAEEYSTWDSAPSMTIFSSRGPNPVAGDIIKPDITAPGLQILAGNSPTPIGGVPGELFQAIAGTSMSSPHIAGVGALLTQANRHWRPGAIKSAIMTTAHQDVVDNDRVSPADPFDMGAGHVDPSGPWGKGSIADPGLIYEVRFNDYLGFLCDAFPEVFSDPASTCAGLAAAGIPTDASGLNLASIGIAELAGSETVRRQVRSVARESGYRTYEVSVDAPDGYDVSVYPTSFTVRNGQPAYYYVTVTNVSAPAGEWRTGSVTWTDTTGTYSAYSPLAVKGILLGAPTAVSGTGESGSGSFDVVFGYTGSYTAAPHGLVADSPTDGEIGQDPDQTYPSPDDDPVGVQKIDFPITGAAFVRWSLVIPGDDDIDLFLEDSSGTIIAQSTQGGTDELIELTLPADDTYTMVVHGWSVPNAPLPYTLHFWEVPLAAGGGSLSVDSAPASATLGAVETIDFSWSGLASGVDYLGAVSHTGDTGLMGLTLIEIDN